MRRKQIVADEKRDGQAEQLPDFLGHLIDGIALMTASDPFLVLLRRIGNADRVGKNAMETPLEEDL